MSEAIAIRDERRFTTTESVYEPINISEAMQLAKTLLESRLLPRAITTQQQAFTIMATGKEMGLTAMQALRSIHVIEGKPSCSSDLILALCKRTPGVCRYFRLVKSDATVATFETLREGDPSPTVMSFTIEEAKAAQLTGKDNWKKYPAAMLRARCIAALARAVYPDLVLGVYETDELAPRAERDVTPVRPIMGRVLDTEPQPAHVEQLREEPPPAAQGEPPHDLSQGEDASEIELQTKIRDQMLVVLEAGFSSWSAKREWREKNKAPKATLPADMQAELSKAFAASTPTGAKE